MNNLNQEIMNMKEFERKLYKRITEFFSSVALDDLGGRELRISLAERITEHCVRKFYIALKKKDKELVKMCEGMKRKHFKGSCRNVTKDYKCKFCKQHYQECDCEIWYDHALKDIINKIKGG